MHQRIHRKVPLQHRGKQIRQVLPEKQQRKATSQFATRTET